MREGAAVPTRECGQSRRGRDVRGAFEVVVRVRQIRPELARLVAGAVGRDHEKARTELGADEDVSDIGSQLSGRREVDVLGVRVRNVEAWSSATTRAGGPRSCPDPYCE